MSVTPKGLTPLESGGRLRRCTENAGHIYSGSSNDNGIHFRYTSEQYIYNLSTKKLTQGTYRIVIDLNDGTQIITYFQLEVGDNPLFLINKRALKMGPPGFEPGTSRL